MGLHGIRVSWVVSWVWWWLDGHEGKYVVYGEGVGEGWVKCGWILWAMTHRTYKTGIVFGLSWVNDCGGGGRWWAMVGGGGR